MKISVAKFAMILITLTALIYLIYDLNYVLTSNGAWSVFMNKLFKATVVVIALFAVINNKVGINTKWMQNKYLETKGIIWTSIAFVILFLVISSSTVQNYFKYKTTDSSEIACREAGLGYLHEHEGDSIACENGTIWLEGRDEWIDDYRDR